MLVHTGAAVDMHAQGLKSYKGRLMHKQNLLFLLSGGTIRATENANYSDEIDLFELNVKTLMWFSFPYVIMALIFKL